MTFISSLRLPPSQPSQVLEIFDYCSEALEPWLAHSCRSLSLFLYHEAARSISTFLDGMLVHRRSLPGNLLGLPNNSPVPVYTPGWRGALWECLAQEHITVSQARVRTRTARSRVEGTEYTAPPLWPVTWCFIDLFSLLQVFKLQLPWTFSRPRTFQLIYITWRMCQDPSRRNPSSH